MIELRTKVLTKVICIILCILGVRILYYSTFKNAECDKAVNSQCVTVKEIGKSRKSIFDRNNIPLTERSVAFIDLSTEENIELSGKNPFAKIPVYERYSNDSHASHLVGYVSSDATGLSGVEKKFNSKLATTDSLYIQYQSDAAGRPIGNVKPVSGTSLPSPDGLQLTIDYHIQKIAEDVMDEYIPKGCVVIMDVRNFQVLAMASRPDFDSSDPSLTHDKSDSPLMNRALCAYNAGSIYKIVTSAAILEKNPDYADSLFFCNGKFESHSENNGDHVFKCHKSDGHGHQLFAQSFANSCNCAFFETGKNAGAENICDMARNFGFGTEILGFGNEESLGNIMEKDTYSEADILNMSIGQGEVLVTPLQCTVMAATIANDGIRKDVSISTMHSCAKNYYVTSPETAGKIGTMMRECVLNGTAKAAAGSTIEIAGKTGSAETGWLMENGEFAVHGWFCGFFPYDNPIYAMTVFCEDGKSGAQSCVEPFVKICEEINKFYPVKQ